MEASYEMVRCWVSAYGPIFARDLRRLRLQSTAPWHSEEMAVSIQGRCMYVWRDVDSEGKILDILVQPRRDNAVALKLMHKLLRQQSYTPSVLVIQKLQSYGAAKREPDLSAPHE